MSYYTAWLVELDGKKGVYFHCPGCGCAHGVPVEEPAGSKWGWNGSLTEPTIWPSVMVNRGTDRQCHSNVTDGKIVFGADCFHELKGTTVPLPTEEA